MAISDMCQSTGILRFVFSGIVVITDGLIELPDPSMFDTLLSQLRHAAVTCSFVLVGSEFSVGDAFSRVPHTELMKFIASTTGGAYFATCAQVTVLVLFYEYLNM